MKSGFGLVFSEILKALLKRIQVKLSSDRTDQLV